MATVSSFRPTTRGRFIELHQTRMAVGAVFAVGVFLPSADRPSAASAACEHRLAGVVDDNASGG